MDNREEYSNKANEENKISKKIDKGSIENNIHSNNIDNSTNSDSSDDQLIDETEIINSVKNQNNDDVIGNNINSNEEKVGSQINDISREESNAYIDNNQNNQDLNTNNITNNNPHNNEVNINSNTIVMTKKTKIPTKIKPILPKKVNKPTPEIIALMNKSVDIEMFLVSENGPLSFTFNINTNIKHNSDDDSEISKEKLEKITITLGSIIKCSCNNNSKSKNTNRTNHCEHSYYVLNRIFKINFANALMYQTQYTERDINMLIKIREERMHKLKNSSSNINDNDTRKNNNISKSHVNSTSKTKITKLQSTKDSKKEKTNSNNKKLSLIDDTNCVICQEDMYLIEGLFCCSVSCGHHFHYRCLSVWAKHKISNYENKFNCPMCRFTWNEEELVKSGIIDDKESRFDKINKANSYSNVNNNDNITINDIVFSKKSITKRIFNTHKGINCSNCDRTNIKMERFKCVCCKNINYCIECFIYLKQYNKHDSSHLFIMKKSENEKWYGVNNEFEYGEIFFDNKGIVRYSVSSMKLETFFCDVLGNKDSSDSKVGVIGDIGLDKEHGYIKEDDVEYISDLRNSDEEVGIKSKLLSNKNNKDMKSNKNKLLKEIKSIEEKTGIAINNNNISIINNNKGIAGIREDEFEFDLTNTHNKSNKNSNKCSYCFSEKHSSLHLFKLLSLPCHHKIHYKCCESMFLTKQINSEIIVTNKFNYCNLCKKSVYIGLNEIITRTEITKENKVNKKAINSESEDTDCFGNSYNNTKKTNLLPALSNNNTDIYEASRINNQFINNNNNTKEIRFNNYASNSNVNYNQHKVNHFQSIKKQAFISHVYKNTSNINLMNNNKVNNITTHNMSSYLPTVINNNSAKLKSNNNYSSYNTYNTNNAYNNSQIAYTSNTPNNKNISVNNAIYSTNNTKSNVTLKNKTILNSNNYQIYSNKKVNYNTSDLSSMLFIEKVNYDPISVKESKSNNANNIPSKIKKTTTLDDLIIPSSNTYNTQVKNIHENVNALIERASKLKALDNTIRAKSLGKLSNNIANKKKDSDSDFNNVVSRFTSKTQFSQGINNNDIHVKTINGLNIVNNVSPILE